jgi:hypothetical protein
LADTLNAPADTQKRGPSALHATRNLPDDTQVVTKHLYRYGTGACKTCLKVTKQEHDMSMRAHPNKNSVKICWGPLCSRVVDARVCVWQITDVTYAQPTTRTENGVIKPMRRSACTIGHQQFAHACQTMNGALLEATESHLACQICAI